MNYNKTGLCIIFFISSSFVFAQQKDIKTNYNPREIFAQNFYILKGNEFRSALGTPGSKYWQNQANYSLQATIDTSNNELTGTAIIHYINNSPDSLQSLWLLLEQNTYRKDARSNFYTSFPVNDHTNGFQIDTVFIEYNGKSSKADYIITDTRMQLRLREKLLNKQTINIHFKYHYTIPGAFGGRTDYVSTKNGKIYEIAQWYPRMCVYDDLEGWSTLPFLGSGEMERDYR